MNLNPNILEDIASLITDTKVTYLTDSQASYLRKAYEQLPGWAKDAIYNKVNGSVMSDWYLLLGTERLDHAIAMLRSLASADILSAGSKPLSELISKINGGTELSFDAIVEKIIKEQTKFKDPYLCNDISIRDFRNQLTDDCSLAVYDCDTIFAKEAYAGELASFRSAIIKKFKPRKWDLNGSGSAPSSSYFEAITEIVEIARADAGNDRHYLDAIHKSIGDYRKALSEDNHADVMTSRKNILFGMLPIDANITEIGWVANTDWLELQSKFELCEKSVQRELMGLGYKSMGELLERAIPSKHPDLKKKVEESIKLIL